MWISTVVIVKAFDTLSHRSLWNALEQFEIEPLYIGSLKGLYERQRGSVLTAKFEQKERSDD